MKIRSIIIFLAICSNALLANNTASPIQYSSFDNAMTVLKNKKSANTRYQEGWTIISLIENNNHVSWFFSPKIHAAYPAVIKKSIVSKGNDLETKIVTLCEAAKPECEKLLKQFKKINADVK